MNDSIHLYWELDDKCKQSLIEPEAFTIYLCEKLGKVQKKKKKMQAERIQVSPKIPVQ